MAKPKRDRPAASKSREEMREEKRQELERQKHRRNAILVIVLVAVVVVAAVILSLTVFFKISGVEVDASKTQYTADQVRTASGIEAGDNLFLMNREEVADNISHQLPYSGEVSVRRSFPSKVKIYVEDSTITSAVRYNDEFIVLNESNKVLAKVGSIDSLNTLVERQAKKKKELTVSKKTTKKTTQKSDSKTSEEATTTTTTTTAVDESAVWSEEESGADIVGGEDLRKATDQVTVITGVEVKEAKVGYPLKAKNAEVFQTYQEIRSAMDRWGVKDITAVDLSKVSDIKLTYQKRITILLGSASGLDRKAAMCARVIEEQDKVSTEQKGTIDLAIEGKAYFSEGGATTRTTTTTTTTVPTLPEDPNGETTTVTGSDVTGTTAVTGTTDPNAPTAADDTTTSTTRDPADVGG